MIKEISFQNIKKVSTGIIIMEVVEIGKTIGKIGIITIVVEEEGTEGVEVGTIIIITKEGIITMIQTVKILKKNSKLIKNLTKVHIKILISKKSQGHMNKNLITIIIVQVVGTTEITNPEDLNLKSLKKLLKLKLLFKNKKSLKNSLSHPDQSVSELILRYQFLSKDANYN